MTHFLVIHLNVICLSQSSKSFWRCFLTLILYESISCVRVSYNMKQANCNFRYLNIWSQYSSVQKVTRLWARHQMDHGSIPGRGKTCLFSKASSQFWGPSSLLFNGYQGIFPMDRVRYYHSPLLVPRLGTNGALPTPTIPIFTACTGILLSSFILRFVDF
jgi:hypothetical protein